MSKEFDYSKEIRANLEEKNFLAAIEIARTMSLKYFNEDISTDL
jgi:hypothetical protein